MADYENKWVSIFEPSGKYVSRIGNGKLLGKLLYLSCVLMYLILVSIFLLYIFMFDVQIAEFLIKDSLCRLEIY